MSQPVSLTFPDGSIREFAAGTTGLEVAESISKSLAKKAVAIAIDGALRDLSDPVVDGKIAIVTRSHCRCRRGLSGAPTHAVWQAACSTFSFSTLKS